MSTKRRDRQQELIDCLFEIVVFIEWQQPTHTETMAFINKTTAKLPTDIQAGLERGKRRFASLLSVRRKG